MGTYEPIEEGDPAVQVAAPSAAGEWIEASHSASDLARFIDEIAGDGSARAGTWRMTAHTGFGGLEATAEWPLELLSEIARGVRDEGSRFVKWVEAATIAALTERAGSVLDAYKECDLGTHLTLGDFAREDINGRGGLSMLEFEEIEAYFDFDKYATSYENDSTFLIVPETAGGVRVYDLERLPPTPLAQPEGVGFD